MRTVTAKLFYALVCAVLLTMVGASDAHAFAIGNRVWYDTNGNGVIDGGETGIDGVTLTLTNSGGGTATTTTSGGGYYLFSGIVAGDYVVTVTKMEFPGGVQSPTSPPKNVLPPKYATEQATPLKANVKPDGENKFDFPL